MSRETLEDKRPEEAERWRVFFAIELPPEVRSCAAQHIERLREEFQEVRAGWERFEKMHLTLKFLGETRVQRVPALTAAAGRAALTTRTFTLAVQGAGAFPPHGAPRVLWLGVRDDEGALLRLQKSLEEECAAAGFEREKRSFRPHLTLARVRGPQGARPLAARHLEMGFEAMEFQARGFVLIRSELGTGGSRYTVIERYDFPD